MTVITSITDVPGVRVGHWTDEVGGTGCTVVLFPNGTVASGEVRGGAPGTREWDLLAPERTVAHLDAVVLAGGSAFGLDACSGVARWCEERGLGFPTAAGPVPIVVGAVLYDLARGDAHARPGSEAGYAACVAAQCGPVATGAVGAGCGATVNKWRGRERMRAGGIGTAGLHSRDLVVSALVAVNAWGDLRDANGAPAFDEGLAFLWAAADAARAEFELQNTTTELENTTIGVIATNANLDKARCLVVAQAGHDGLARAVEPVHASADGDAFVAAAVGGVDAPLEVVRALAARAVEAAIRDAVG